MVAAKLVLSRLAIVLPATFLAVGCGHGKLVPAASAAVVPGAPGAAFLIVDGVRCSADVDAWTGRPGDLPSFVTPVKVRVGSREQTPVSRWPTVNGS